MGEILPQLDDFGGQVPPRLPWVPQAGRENEPPSIFVQRAVKSMEYPPLFVRQSWTKSVPSKDTYEYYKPSETIGRSLNKSNH